MCKSAQEHYAPALEEGTLGPRQGKDLCQVHNRDHSVRLLHVGTQPCHKPVSSLESQVHHLSKPVTLLYQEDSNYCIYTRGCQLSIN